MVGSSSNDLTGIRCNNATCDEAAAVVMAWSAVSIGAVFVAPFCERHASEVETDLRAQQATVLGVYLVPESLPQCPSRCERRQRDQEVG